MTLLGKKYQQPSFRGVPFEIEGYDSGDFSQRVSEHLYPNRAPGYVRPLGQKQGEHQFDAFVIGEEYEAKRDALIGACVKDGPGVLIHPFLGTLKVVCTGCRVRETVDALGKAKVSLTFKEAGELLFPSPAPDTAAKTLAAATTTLAAVVANFEKACDLASAPGFVISEIEDRVRTLTTAMNTVARSIRRRTQSIADFSYRVRNIRANVSSLINTPGQLAEQFQDALASLTNLLPGSDRKEVRLAYQGFFSFGDSFAAVGTSTSNRVTQGKAETAVKQLAQRTAIALAANEAAQESFESLEDALAVQAALTDKLDALAEEAAANPEVEDTDDAVFNALQGLRKQILQAVPPQNESLPELVDFVPDDSVPALLITYDLYGSSAPLEALVARNRISHPGFIPGGRAIRVLRGGLV